MKIAVIGAGQFGKVHIETIGRNPDCELVGVADPAYRDEKGFTDYREMLDEAKPDGVIVATPNTTHVPIGLACIERRVPVLMEKPIAETVAEAMKLVTAAEMAKVPLMVGHHRRHNPLMEKAREIVQGGALGRLVAVAVLWMLHKHDAYYEAAWRREPGGGPLLINCIHDVDDLRYLCGEMAEVQAIVSTSTRNLPVEDTAAIAVRFASGALGTVTVSDTAAAPWAWEVTSGEYGYFARHPENCYFLTGTEASLALPRMELWRHGAKNDWYSPLQKEPVEILAEDSQTRQLRHFLRVIRGEEAPRSSGAEATRTLAAVLAMHESARTGRIVKL